MNDYQKALLVFLALLDPASCLKAVMAELQKAEKKESRQAEKEG